MKKQTTKSDNIKLSEFKALMFDRVIPIKDLKDNNGEPLYKILNYWRRYELLPFVDPGKWISVSCMQLIWIRILDDLRYIGFPILKMKSVCDYFFKDAYDDNLAKQNFKYNKDLIEKKKLAGTQSEEDDALLKMILEGLENKRLLSILNTNVSYLSNFIAAVLANEEDGNICIFFDDTVKEYVGNNYYGHTGKKTVATDPQIKLSIGHYFKEFLDDEQLFRIVMPQILNEDEVKVLREMRQKNIKEITITSGDKGQKRTIKSTKTGILSEEDAMHIKEILGLKNYEAITLETLDEKNVSFKKTRKKI